MHLLLFFIVCLIASAGGAISGIGGGIIIKPVLEIVSDYGVDAISFLSACTVLSMSAVSLLSRRGTLKSFEYRRGTFLAVGSAIGGVVGKLGFNAVGALFSENGLGAAQSILLIVIIIGLLAYMGLKNRVKTRSLQSGSLCLLIGFGLGILSSFLGIGGGPMNLAVLSYFLSMDIKTASIHSIYVILFSQTASLILTLAQRDVPAFPTSVLICVILGGVAGALLGSAFAKRMKSNGIEAVYAAILVFVLCVSARNLYVYMHT